MTIRNRMAHIPFAANVEIADSPWNEEYRLIRIGLKGKDIPQGERPSTNLVFLLGRVGVHAAL